MVGLVPATRFVEAHLPVPSEVVAVHRRGLSCYTSSTRQYGASLALRMPFWVWNIRRAPGYDEYPARQARGAGRIECSLRTLGRHVLFPSLTSRKSGTPV